MLADDVVVWTDGGGRCRAALRPVVGPHRSSRFLINVAKKGTGRSPATVLNGQPANVFVDDGRVVAALVLDIMEGAIVGVRVISNPDKLARLNSQLFSGSAEWVRLGTVRSRAPVDGPCRLPCEEGRPR